MRIVAIDGVRVEEGEARASVFDRGFLYGDGVFAVLRANGGAPVDLAAHLEQLAADAGALGMAVPDHVAAAVREVGRELGQARVRVMVFRGEGGLGARWSEVPVRSVVIAEEAGATKAELQAVVLDEPRLVPSRTWAPKAMSYVASLIARERAVAMGADEGLRLFPDDTVGEGAACNLFAIFNERRDEGGGEGGDVVVTPPALGIRPGVTRRRVMELCAAQGLACVERAISRAELPLAKEIFVTSSIAGVVPVVSLDGKPRDVGTVSRDLRARYEQRAAELTG
jgi:branched-subunit amino acid aminotransferase/4-amino-4-deoxychorismate lyase